LYEGVMPLVPRVASPVARYATLRRAVEPPPILLHRPCPRRWLLLTPCVDLPQRSLMGDSKESTRKVPGTPMFVLRAWSPAPCPRQGDSQINVVARGLSRPRRALFSRMSRCICDAARRATARERCLLRRRGGANGSAALAANAPEKEGVARKRHAAAG